MIVRFGLLRRRLDLTPQEFRRHWLEIHGPLAAKTPGLLAYHQNYVVDRRQLGVDHARGAWDIDGFSELWFEAEKAMDEAIASWAYPPQREDLPKFAADVRIVVAEQRTVVPFAASGGPWIKRMSFLTRTQHVSPERFREEWFGKHAELVKKFPTLLGYRQNLILRREAVPGKATDYASIPADGIVEMWFADEAALQASFGHEAAVHSQAHAREFIAEISPFLVEVHEIV